MVLGGEAFGEGLDHENGAPRNGTSAPIKKTPERPPTEGEMWSEGVITREAPRMGNTGGDGL